MSAPEKIKLIIADDHQMMLDGLKSIIKSDKSFELIGEALNGNDAFELAKNESVDILLTDINMPGMGGIELTQKIKALKPDLQVLVLSMYSEKGMISEMLSAGASGYILKNTGKEELLGALHKLAIGGMYFSDEVAVEMMKAMVTPKPASTDSIKLTPREIEIIQLIDKELNNAAIAEKLFISERTVETHRKNIFRKTKTKGVVGLLKFAVEHNIL